MMLQSKKDTRLEPADQESGTCCALFISAQNPVPSTGREHQRRDTTANIAAHAHVGGVPAPQLAAAAYPNSHSLTKLGKQLSSPTSRGDIAEWPRPHSKTSKTLAPTRPNGFWRVVGLAALGLLSWQCKALPPVPLESRGDQARRLGDCCSPIFQARRAACPATRRCSGGAALQPSSLRSDAPAQPQSLAPCPLSRLGRGADIEGAREPRCFISRNEASANCLRNRCEVLDDRVWCNSKQMRPWKDCTACMPAWDLAAWDDPASKRAGARAHCLPAELNLEKALPKPQTVLVFSLQHAADTNAPVDVLGLQTSPVAEEGVQSPRGSDAMDLDGVVSRASPWLSQQFGGGPLR